MNDSRWNVDHRSGPDILLLAIEDHFAFAGQDVVKLGGDFVVVRFCTIDIDRVSPGRDILIALTEQAVAASDLSLLATSPGSPKPVLRRPQRATLVASIASPYTVGSRV